MISVIKAYKSSDGQTFDTLEKVQQHEIELILESEAQKQKGAAEVFTLKFDESAQIIVQNAEKIIDILSTKGNSRPAARKANGAVRKKRTTPTPADRPAAADSD